MFLFKTKPITSDQQHKRMTEMPIQKLIISMALPSTLIQLITVIYNTADTFFVAQISTSATAAVGVVFSLMALIQAFGFGIAMGSSSIISRYLGAKDTQRANRIGSSAFFISFFVGLLIMILGLSFLSPLMKLLGSTQTILPYSCDYASYILLGAPLMCSTFVLNNILRSEGQVYLAMFGMCFGGILNMFLDPWFIFGLNLGIKGAAIATLISQVFSFSLLLSAFIFKKSIVIINLKFISKDINDYILIIKTGLPTICRQGLSSLATSLLNIQAANFGDSAVAAITIANKIYMLERNIVLGIGQGFQPVAGYNYGASKFKRVKKSFKFACLLGTLICILCSIFIAIYSPQIIAWFRNDSKVVEIGHIALYYVCAVMPLMAFSTYANQLFQCLGFSKSATFLACCRQGIFFVPLILILPYFISLNGVILTQPLSDLCTFLISIPFVKVFFKNQLDEQNLKSPL